MAEIQYYGTGRRKTAVARVYLRPGSGKIKVNRRDFDDYFPNQVLKMVIRQPLQRRLEQVEPVLAVGVHDTILGVLREHVNVIQTVFDLGDANRFQDLAMN